MAVHARYNESKSKDETAKLECKIHSDISIPFPLRSFNNYAMKSRQLVQELINRKSCKISCFLNFKLN